LRANATEQAETIRRQNGTIQVLLEENRLFRVDMERMATDFRTIKERLRNLRHDSKKHQIESRHKWFTVLTKSLFF
jgi:hypothetical protein